jgi:TrbL/VirB6 plasmid conjugal transfer protein
MKYAINIFFLVVLSLTLFASDSSARFFAPGGDDNVVGGDTRETRNMNYSATWDAGFPLVVCAYRRLDAGTPDLIINKLFVAEDSAKVLFGIDDPASCPMPGNKIFDGYNNAVAGEFLISGVICVVNTIIFEAMFKVYCTIILWVYNILYALIIIYIMFYGLSIMIGIGNDPVKEAPKRIIKIFLIFFLAVNAQVGFRLLHNGFISALNGFTEMLTDVQPYHDEYGHPAYDKTFAQEFLADFSFGILSSPGKLLDQSGKEWRPTTGSYWRPNPAFSTDPKKYNDPKEYISESMPGSVADLTPVSPEKYVPFRVAAQQWAFERPPAPVPVPPAPQYKMYPVFKELAISPADVAAEKIACIFDVRYSANRNRLEFYPHCQKNFFPTMPAVTPYGKYYLHDRDDGTWGVTGLSNAVTFAPTRLLKPSLITSTPRGNKTVTCEDLSLAVPVALPVGCRQAFQGVLAKVDAIFNATMGDDSSKNLMGLAVALASWGVGAGAVLSALLMTGVITLFVASFQLIWTYVTAIMAITFLLMLSPIFITFALFKITEKLFQGWFSALISYSMQPFLIMAFLFVLSSVTSTDKLKELSRKEIGRVQKKADIGGGNQIKTTAVSVLGTLYEKPADFERIYYENVVQKGDDSNPNILYINTSQRKKYIERKGEYILNYWMCVQGGAGDPTSPDFTQEDAKACADYGLREPLVNLWYDGKWFDVDVGKKGIEAVIAVSALGTGDFDELITCYQQGCAPIPGLDSAASAANPISIDDGDSFVGEPQTSVKAGGQVHYREYPVALKYFPEFKPSYVATDPVRANPRINLPVLPQYSDGTPCPIGNDGQTSIMCAPNAECVGYCMNIKDSMDINFGGMTGAIIGWIILNMVSAAFIAKIPSIAEGLSKWSNYAPSGMPLGGGSRSWDDTGMDNWSQQERSGFFHMGGLFDTGIVSGRAAGLPLLLSTANRVGKGAIETVGKDGVITTQPRQHNPRAAFAPEKDEAKNKTQVKVLREFKRMLGLKDEERFSSDKKAEKSTLQQFAELRPESRTGLAHSVLWDEMRKVMDNNPTADEFTLKQMIKNAVEKLINPPEDPKPPKPSP